MMVCSVAIQALSVAMLWRDIDWHRLATFLAGGFAGLPLGITLLLHLGSAGFNEAIGGLLTLYAGVMLLKRPISIAWSGRTINTVVGFAGGVTGGLAAFPGAFVTIWCGMRGWDKRRQRGIYQPFILLVQIAALVIIQVSRPSMPIGLILGPGSLQFVPPALLGTLIGLSIFKGMSDRIFMMAVNVLLLGSGVGLLA
jgi:uncharacterized protein